MSASPIDSILLLGFGGPERPGDVESFVRGVSGGRNVSETRIQQVIRQYQAVGGVSPFNEWSARQALALKRKLDEQGYAVPVLLGMRHWTPWIIEALRELIETGRRHTLVVILTAHVSMESREKYQATVAQATARLGGQAPRLTWFDLEWHTDPRYIGAMADHVRATAASLEPAAFRRSRLICTAHAIPQAANGCPERPCPAGECCRQPTAPFYCRAIHETAFALGHVLALPHVVVAFQSAAGGPIPWTGPDVNDVIRKSAADGIENVILSPVGFLCDHVEVLYDLDIQARETAESCHLGFYRASTAAIHPDFIAMLADYIGTYLHAE